jgi:hypothetical protein
MKKHLLIMAAAGMALLGSLGQARAQLTPLFVYSVKFVCGLQVVPSIQFPPPREPTVKPGNYVTAINVHNYHLKATALRKKAVIALPESILTRGRISTIVAENLGPNQALTVDCNEIVKLFPVAPVPLPPFIDGFVEIVSPVQLSVAAVYTSQTCTNPANRCTILGDLDLEVVPQQAFRDQ